MLLVSVAVALGGQAPLSQAPSNVAVAVPGDIDDDGIPDPADAEAPQPGEDFCQFTAEDSDGVDDDDGCPDSDVSATGAAEEAYTVMVSTTETKTLDIWVGNGNYPADVVIHALAVSTVGECEVDLVPEAGDLSRQYNTDEDGDSVEESYRYLVEWELSMAPGEAVHTSRDYQVHCFEAGDHTFELQVDAAPTLPVVEEDVVDLSNVDRIFPAVTAAVSNLADSDGDGFIDDTEGFVGTDPNDACGAAAWPPDFDDSARVDIFDVNIMKPAFFSTPPDAPYDARLELEPDSIVDIFDVNELTPYFFVACTP